MEFSRSNQASLHNDLNWFLYWQYAPALWREEIEKCHHHSKILVPINWGCHVRGHETCDFGEDNPQANLKYLIEVFKQSQREFTFVLPFTPFPLMENGGVPKYLARYKSTNAQGLAHVVVDQQGQINILHSFYDSRVFKDFRKFVWNLGEYFKYLNKEIEVLAFECFYCDQQVESFFSDFSPAFEEGYNRFCTSNQEEDSAHLSPFSYSEQVKELYTSTLEEFLGDYLTGAFRVGFVSASYQEIFKKLQTEKDSAQAYFEEFMNLIKLNLVPTRVLLDAHSPALNQTFKDYYSSGIVTYKLDEQRTEQGGSILVPEIKLRSFANDTPLSHQLRSFHEWGLQDYFSQNFPHCYRFEKSLNYDEQMDTSYDGEILLVQNGFVDEELFTTVLKLFMAGKNILIPRSSLGEQAQAKLEVFLSENNLKPQQVHFITPVLLVKFSEGTLVVFDEKKLTKQAGPHQFKFWDNLTHYIGLSLPKLEVPPEVGHYWRTRESTTNELDYCAIKRASFYNFSNSTKKVKASSLKNFAFIRSIDPNEAKVTSTPIGVEVELRAHGSVSLDYGYFEE